MNCFVDYKITTEEFTSLKKLGFNIIKIPKCTDVYNAINGHPDIQLCILNNITKEVIINKNISSEFKNQLIKNKISYKESYYEIMSPYPNNIGLNALITDEFLIHKISNTDKNLLNIFESSKKLINVKQGYTKCSCLQISDKAIITNDKGLHKKLLELSFDVLLLPYGDIILEDFDYGFIGGVGGMISAKELALFGNLNKYKYGEDVKSFLSKHDVTPIYLANTKLIDRGSLFVI
ncbi:MAG: hypothetical protein RR620_01975 [Clostridium sp.]